MDSSKKSHHAALLALRIGLGVIFILHGYAKLFGTPGGMAGFTKMVGGLHFPAAGFFAYAAACSEFFGGIAILLGIYPRVASIFIAIVMMVVLVGVKKFSFPKSDAEFALLIMAVAINLMGAGNYSLANLLKRKEQSPVPVESEA